MIGQGTVRGKVTDANDGSEIPFANVTVIGTTIGSSTNMTGDYSLENVPSGDQTIEVSFIGYAKKTVTVKVEAGKVTVKNISLGNSAIQVGAATIEVREDRREENYYEKIKIKNASSLDYFSGAQMQKTGDGTADEALKRVPGVSTVGNFVFVRGLSDRYLKTTLNGAEIPSINPRRNSLEMDIFPTNLIDNLVVVKTQQANLPADWAGAYLSVETRDFPSKFNFSYQLSLGYNENASLQDVISSERSDTDWLGFDDGFRDVPQVATDAVDGTFPTIAEVCFYDALVFGGFENQLSDMGINECGDIGPLGQMNINEVLANIEEIENTEQLITEYLQPLGEVRNADLTEINQSFTNTWENTRRTAPLDMSHNISFGDQGKLFGRTLGYIFGAQYNRSTRYYNDGIYERWATGIPEISDSLTINKRYSDERSYERVYWNALLNLSYELNENNQISVMAMPNVSGTNTSRYQEGINPQDTEDFQVQRTQRYNERTLNVFQFRGKHLIPSKRWKVWWNSSYSKGKMSTPDLKVMYNNFRYVTERFYTDDQGQDITEQVLEAIDELVDDGAITGASDPDLAEELLSEYDLVLGNINEEVVDTTYTIEPSIYPTPTRFFRTLEESKWDTKVHLEIPLGTDPKKKNLFSAGLSYVRTTRAHSENTFSLASQGLRFEGDVNAYFADSNLVVIPNENYLYTQNLTDLINTDEGELDVYGAYGMLDYYFGKKLRLNTGLRMEIAKMDIRSLKLDDEDEVLSQQQRDALQGGLDDFDLMPSLNLIYKLKETEDLKLTNLRFSYSRTIARPVFREKSPFRGFDFETLETLKGNPKLDATKVDNFDLRIEHFPRGGNAISFTVFYKRFTDPIEQQAVLQAINTELTWANIPYANVIGAEFDFKQNFAFISPKLEPLQFSANLSLIRSRARLAEEELNFTRLTDPQHEDVRPLFGQSPYIVNTMLSYTNDSTGWSTALSFNVQGEKLILIYVGGAPDIYQQPQPTLDFTLRKLFKNNIQLGFKAQNILAPDNRKTYEFKGELYDWNTFNLGRTYSFSIAYRIK